MESRGVSCQVGTATKEDDFRTRMKTDEIARAGTAGRKCVSSIQKQDSDFSDSDFEEEGTDNLVLGRLRKGMNVIQNYARETMAGCDTDESRIDMAQRLEKSQLGMLRAEKSFLSTTRIISEIVDEFASDFEDEENEVEDLVTVQNGTTAIGDSSASGPELQKKSAIPIVFRPTVANGLSIRTYGCKLSEMMNERLAKYEEGLTDDVLRSEKKFLELQKQIQSGKQDSENNSKSLEIYRGAGDMDEVLCPRTNLFFESREEEDTDETVLPITDPITLKPIYTAVRNKFCNHIFDQASIRQLILSNPNATCPVYGCQNERPFSSEDFIKESGLTEKIRMKNSKLE